MNLLKYAAVFMAGVGVGVVIGKRYYNSRLDDILADYDTLEEEYHNLKNEDSNQVKIIYEKEDLYEAAKEWLNNHPESITELKDDVMSKQDYEDIILEQKYDTMPKKKVRKIIDRPFEIEETEYGAVYDYNLVHLNYYADDVLTDEYDNVVDDVREIVGDVLEVADLIPFSDVYVRNDAKRCDYKIFIDPKTFERLCAETQLEEEYSGE